MNLLERFDAAYQRLKASERSLRFEDVTRRLGDSGHRRAAGGGRLPARRPGVAPAAGRVPGHLGPAMARAAALRPARGRRRRAIALLRGRRQAGDLRLAGRRGRDLRRPGRRVRPAALAGAQPELPLLARGDRLREPGLRRASPATPCCNKCPAAAQKWSQRFTEHTTARKTLPGYCRLITAAAAAEGEDQATATLRFAAEEVVRLHEQSPQCEIGVLVRRNEAVARLIFELRSRGIEASEEGGNPLTDSPAVQILLSLLTLADHPGDTTARFHVAHSPLAEHVGLTEHCDSPAAWRLAEEVRRRLMVEGYGPVLEGWAETLAAACDRRDVSRLAQLVEMAYGYEDRATMRADGFRHPGRTAEGGRSHLGPRPRDDRPPVQGPAVRHRRVAGVGRGHERSAAGDCGRLSETGRAASSGSAATSRKTCAESCPPNSSGCSPPTRSG